jgi:hypothetical protein
VGRSQEVVQAGEEGAAVEVRRQRVFVVDLFVAEQARHRSVIPNANTNPIRFALKTTTLLFKSGALLVAQQARFAFDKHNEMVVPLKHVIC